MTPIERWYQHPTTCDKPECCAYINAHLDDLVGDQFWSANDQADRL
jgi:hypothetical protein